MRSKSSVIAALDKIEELDNSITQVEQDSGLMELRAERNELERLVRQYVLDKGNVETDTHKLTRVQGFTRGWDGVKLEKLVPKGLFLKIVDYVPNADKIDELVKAGKLDIKTIKSAFIEVPKAPYAKITKKKADDTDEAERVAQTLA